MKYYTTRVPNTPDVELLHQFVCVIFRCFNIFFTTASHDVVLLILCMWYSVSGRKLEDFLLHSHVISLGIYLWDRRVVSFLFFWCAKKAALGMLLSVSLDHPIFYKLTCWAAFVAFVSALAKHGETKVANCWASWVPFFLSGLGENQTKNTHLYKCSYPTVTPHSWHTQSMQDFTVWFQHHVVSCALTWHS